LLDLEVGAGSPFDCDVRAFLSANSSFILTEADLRSQDVEDQLDWEFATNVDNDEESEASVHVHDTLFSLLHAEVREFLRVSRVTPPQVHAGFVLVPSAPTVNSLTCAECLDREC